MFASVNKKYEQARRDKKNDEFIAESVMDVGEVSPGSDEEMDDVVDTDSVPDEAYKKLDAELDKLVSDPNYDDTEAEEMADGDDDDFDDDDISDEDLEVAISECVNAMPDERQDW